MAKSFHTLRDPIMADPESRAHVEEQKRAILDALALAALCERRAETQQAAANAPPASRPRLCQIEHQENLYLSTLSHYVAALGGRLEITAIFPDQTIEIIAPAGASPVSGSLPEDEVVP